jgi:hypothetical protein
VGVSSGDQSVTVTVGGGPTAGTGVSASVGGMASNAGCAKQLGGGFSYASVGAAWIYGGGLANTSHAGSIHTVFAGASIGVGGASASGGKSYTWVFGSDC